MHPMADTSKALQALTESRPPATDGFTYLTIIEKVLSPEILPELNDILQDPKLTQEIGWDLVDMLVPVQGCEQCLETVARLGNPRETIIKVLEVMEGLQAEEDGLEDQLDLLTTEDDEDDDGAEASNGAKDLAKTPQEVTRRFIILLGMLAILHQRIKTKFPSRFLATSLLTVYRTYQPNQEMTASIINLVHSLSGLSGQKARPSLPTRKSSIEVANPDRHGDASKNAPDPEADNELALDPDEEEIQRRLLLSFTSCVLESYVNANDMQWSRRLLEFYSPEKIVPGRKTATAAFREVAELENRDTMVGKLVVGHRSLCVARRGNGMLTPDSGTYPRSGPVVMSPISHSRHLQWTDQQGTAEEHGRSDQSSRYRPIDRWHHLSPCLLGLLIHCLRSRPTPARNVSLPRSPHATRELPRRRP